MQKTTNLSLRACLSSRQGTKQSIKYIFTLTITLLRLFTFTTAQNIGDIQISFCKENEINKELDIITQANQETDICLEFKNNSLQDTTISIDFTDGAITPSGKKSCMGIDKPKKKFANYIKDFEKNLNIPGNSSIKQNYKINFPIGFSGISHGCIGYQINNKSNLAGGIDIIFRKVFSIDVLVGGTKINSNLKVKNINFSGDQVSNKLMFKIQNKGNISQSVQISGTINNPFGYSQKFNTEKKIIPANEYKILKTKNLNIPDYKGIFFTKSTLSYQPKFNFDITNHNIPNQYTIAGIISISKTLILRNWFYITSLALILILVSIIVLKHRR